MRVLKTTLPDSITTLDQAKAYLTNLYNNGESYHPDDDSKDCLNGISEQDGKHMNMLMDQVFELFTANGLDVYMFLLDLDGHVIED